MDIQKAKTSAQWAKGCASNVLSRADDDPEAALSFAAYGEAFMASAREALTPDPPPVPEDIFRGLVKRPWSPQKSGDWSQKLIEDGMIQDLPGGVIEFSVPAGGRQDQRRCEVQAHRLNDGGCDLPTEMGYQFDFLLPEESVLPTSRASGWSTICQHHTDQPCYTGGLQIHLDGYLGVSIKGGKTYDWNSSCVQDYEERLPFSDPLARGEWYTVQQRVRWHESDGAMKIHLNGQPAFWADGIPTTGEHDDPQHPATHNKFRLGIYAFVYPGEFSFQVRNVGVWES